MIVIRNLKSGLIGIASPRVLAFVALRSAVDGRPVIAHLDLRTGRHRIIRPLGSQRRIA